MNKYLIFLLIGVCAGFLTACGGDDGEDSSLTVTPGSVSLFYDGTQQLSAPGATNWNSEDEFIASVDQSGKVEARHVGTTNVIASNGNRMGKCAVTIVAKYNLYDTPILKWGASVSQIKAAETHEFSAGDDSVLGYIYDNGSLKTVVMYVFENGSLKSILAVNDKDKFAAHAMYLLERYQPVGYDSDMYVFMDAMDVKQSKMMVSLSYQKFSNNTVTAALYIKSSDVVTRSSGNFVEVEKLPMLDNLIKLLD